MTESAPQSHRAPASPRSIVIVADDLTGAADCAVPFRLAGFSAVVLASLVGHRVALPRAQVVSLSLHTRDIPSVAGVRRVWRRVAPAIATLAQDALVYHKIDSTLRGHPALEVRLLLDLLGLPAAVIAPAFPKLGRQTLDGVHRVHGVPLAQTEYASKQTRALASSSLPELFAAASGPSPAHLPWPVIDRGADEVATWLQHHLAEPGRLITADAAHERHLEILTQATLSLAQRPLLVGSAGWAERLALACKGLIAEPPPVPGALGVVGSLNTVAVRQVQAAMRAGVGVIRFPPAPIEDATAVAADVRQTQARALAAGRHVVIWTHPGDVTSGSGGGQAVLRALGQVVKETLSATLVSGLAIVGGETARAVFRALHASGLTLSGEIAAGIPYGHLVGGVFAGLAVATKAGGFGAETALLDCLDFLQRSAPQ